VVFLDSNLNGSYEDEQPLHDYRQGRETIALGTKPVTLAANFEDLDGTPSLDFYFDTGAHGTHVAESQRGATCSTCRDSTAWRRGRSSSA